MSEVIKNSYETVVVLSTTVGEEGAEQLLGKIKALIEKHGTLGEIDEWGKRKLAYPINDEPEGLYYVINFESDPEFPAEFDRVCKITDGILRILTIRK